MIIKELDSKCGYDVIIRSQWGNYRGTKQDKMVYINDLLRGSSCIMNMEVSKITLDPQICGIIAEIDLPPQIVNAIADYAKK